MGSISMFFVDSAHCSHSLSSPLPRLFSSLANRSYFCHGSFRIRHPHFSLINLDGARLESCIGYPSPSIDQRSQLFSSVWPVPTSQQRHVCSCSSGKDDMVMDIRNSEEGGWGTEQDLLNSFKQMLSMDENSFFYGTEDDDEDVAALKDASLLRAIVKDAVTVIGYPLGGTTVSVTKGVVSRIEVTSYAHGDSELLAVQIDAAINPGNSGGPAFNDDGDCVGIAFQAHDSADNIGYVIPTPVIHHFLKDYNKHGHYTGFPSLGVIFQTLTNPDLRKFLQMNQEQKGILVQKVEPLSPSKEVLKEGDVILSFDGIPISNEATVPLRPGERTALSFLVSQKFTGDKAVLGVLRDGKEIALTTTLRPPSLLVPVHIRNRHPTYFIVAGFVFTAVTEPLLLESYSEDNLYVQMRLRASAGFNMAEFEGQEMVLLSQVLAHAVNIGYEDVSHLKALRFNGTRIKNMQHLAELVDSCRSPYMQFELEHSILVVLATDSARASTPNILKEYCIAHDRSQDLRASTEDSSFNGCLTC